MKKEDKDPTVVRVASGPQGDGAVLPELSRVRVDVDRNQTRVLNY
jgi:hypothetical protein